MDCQRWIEVLPEFFTIGHVLDHVIRVQIPREPSHVPDVQSVSETPQPFVEDSAPAATKDGSVVTAGSQALTEVHDHSIAEAHDATTEVPSGMDSSDVFMVDDAPTPTLSLLGFLLGIFSNQVTLKLDDERLLNQCCLIWANDFDAPLYLDVSASTTVANIVRAEARMYSCPEPAEITNAEGWCVQWNIRVFPGQILIAWPQHVLDLALGKQVEGLWESSPLPRMAGILFMRESRLLPRLPVTLCNADDSVEIDEIPTISRAPLLEAAKTDAPVAPVVCGSCSPTCIWTEPAHTFHVPVSDQGTQPLLDVSPVTPFLGLTPDQLCRLSLPEIQSEMHWQALQSQHFSASDRNLLLQVQQDLLADDEMRFHLQQMVIARNQRVATEGVKLAVYIDPLVFSTSLNGPTTLCRAVLMQLAPTVVSGGTLVTALYSQGHWIPVHCNMANNQLRVWTWDDPNADHSDLDALTSAIQHLFGCASKVICRHHRLFFRSTHCGAMALAFISHALNRTSLPESEFEALVVHQRLREKFVAALNGLDQVPRPWCWASGAKDSISDRLANLLREKGVRADQSGDRAMKAVRAIGIDAIDKAMGQPNPWRQLKTLGNHSKFQFLTPAEIKAVITNNKSQPVGVKRKTAKEVKKKTPEVTSMDPGKLNVMPGAFKIKDRSLAQLSVSQLGPAACGVVLVDVITAEPYIRANQQVSTEALAMLVLGDISGIPTKLTHAEVSVPCTCNVNHEPIIVQATMFQLGGQLVHKYVGDNPIQMDTFDVCALKMMLYRDEIGCQWDEVTKAPVRYIVSQLPVLSLCSAQNCDCPCWHNGEGLPISDPLVNVWRRQFLQQGFRPCKPVGAIMYVAFIRIPACLRDQVLAASGIDGLYCEPRSSDGLQIDPEFAVIWTTKLSPFEMIHVKQTRPEVIGLARLQDRRGFRTKAGDACDLHKALKPGQVYLPTGQKLEFQGGPFPYGVDRTAISAAFAKANWSVKAVQPSMPIAGRGNMWLLHAVTAPPSSVLMMSHGEVMITALKPETVAGPHQLPPVATAATLAICGSKPVSSAPSSGVDLLQTHDPWKGWQGPARGIVAQPSAQESLAKIEQRIEKSIMSKLPSPQVIPMDQDDVPDRLTSLETQMQQMSQKQQQLEQSLADTSSHHSQQMAGLQAQMHAQTQQLHGKMESHHQGMQAMLEAQMGQIRSLLSKRNANDMDAWQPGEGWSALCVATFVVSFLVWTVGCTKWFCLYLSSLIPVVSRQHHNRCSSHLPRWQFCGSPFARGRRKFCSCSVHLPVVQLILVLFASFRIGEAMNPGPEFDVDLKDRLVLGCFNPSGLGNKAPQIKHDLEYGDIWSVSETHLSSRALFAFRSSLRFERSAHQCIAGHPVPARAHSASAGTQ